MYPLTIVYNIISPTQKSEILAGQNIMRASHADAVLELTKAAELVQAQQEEIASLQAQLESVGAGGVEPLRKQNPTPSNPGELNPESPTNIDSPFNTCMYQDHCKQWKASAQAFSDQPVAWRYIPDAWKSVVLTDDPERAKLASEYGYNVTPLHARQTP